MMMQMPRDIAPTRMASAMLCSCTISFQRWYGVILSITMKATTKMNIPINAKISAATMLPSGTRFILFASCVMVIAAVNRAVRAGIIADRLRNIFQLIDSVKAPATILAESGGTQSQQSVEAEDRHVANHIHGVRNHRKRGIDLGLNAQIVVACGDARDYHFVGLFS